jgi:hypothetical protein
MDCPAPLPIVSTLIDRLAGSPQPGGLGHFVGLLHHVLILGIVNLPVELLDLLGGAPVVSHPGSVHGHHHRNAAGRSGFGCGGSGGPGRGRDGPVLLLELIVLRPPVHISQALELRLRILHHADLGQHFVQAGHVLAPEPGAVEARAGFAGLAHFLVVVLDDGLQLFELGVVVDQDRVHCQQAQLVQAAAVRVVPLRHLYHLVDPSFLCFHSLHE